MRSGAVFGVEGDAGKRSVEGSLHFGGGSGALLGSHSLEGRDGTVDWIEASLQSGTGEVDGEVVGESPDAEPDQDEEKKNRQDAHQAVGKKEAVANTPKQAALYAAERAEGDKETQWKKNKQRGDGPDIVAGEIEGEIERQEDQKSDPRLAEAPGNLANSRHLLIMAGRTRLG
jgi:hypothetical protein